MTVVNLKVEGDPLRAALMTVAGKPVFEGFTSATYATYSQGKRNEDNYTLCKRRDFLLPAFLKTPHHDPSAIPVKLLASYIVQRRPHK